MIVGNVYVGRGKSRWIDVGGYFIDGERVK